MLAILREESSLLLPATSSLIGSLSTVNVLLVAMTSMLISQRNRFCAGCCIALLVAFSRSHANEPLQYNRDIRPILFDSCISCHGPDSASREADLRLDVRDAAIDAAQ